MYKNEFTNLQTFPFSSYLPIKTKHLQEWNCWYLFRNLVKSYDNEHINNSLIS